MFPLQLPSSSVILMPLVITIPLLFYGKLSTFFVEKMDSWINPTIMMFGIPGKDLLFAWKSRATHGDAKGSYSHFSAYFI